MTDFSSIDRLVEFGMGMGLAQQMVNTMNNTMSNMHVAGVNAQSTGCVKQPGGVALPPMDSGKWYVVVDEKMAGPLSEEELTTLIKKGRIADNTLLWREGMQSWMMAQDIPEVNKYLLLS